MVSEATEYREAIVRRLSVESSRQRPDFIDGQVEGVSRAPLSPGEALGRALEDLTRTLEGSLFDD